MITHRFRTPYQRIIRAAHRGKGVHLSALECVLMSRNHAIVIAAIRDNCPKGFYDTSCGEAQCPVHGAQLK